MLLNLKVLLGSWFHLTSGLLRGAGRAASVLTLLLLIPSTSPAAQTKTRTTADSLVRWGALFQDALSSVSPEERPSELGKASVLLDGAQTKDPELRLPADSADLRRAMQALQSAHGTEAERHALAEIERNELFSRSEIDSPYFHSISWQKDAVGAGYGPLPQTSPVPRLLHADYFESIDEPGFRPRSFHRDRFRPVMVERL